MVSEKKMDNGYHYKEDPWFDERFHAPKEESIRRGYGKTMDDVVVVDHLKPGYPTAPGIFKLDVDCEDLVEGIWDELQEQRDFILAYRKGYKQKRDRFMVVYPSGDNHRVKNVSPNRYDLIKNYDDDVFGVGLTCLIHLPTGTWVYMHERKPIGPHVEQLIDRILEERVDMRGEDRADYVVEMAVSFKGPKCILGRHCDHDDDNDYCRYHAILRSSSKNYIATGHSAAEDYVISPKVGEIWAFAVTHPHWAGNDHEEETAWHLVVDVIRKDQYQIGNTQIK